MRNQEHIEHYIEIRSQVKPKESHIAQYLKGVDKCPQVLHHMRPIKNIKINITYIAACEKTDAPIIAAIVPFTATANEFSFDI